MFYLLGLGAFVWLLGYADQRTRLQQHNYKTYLIIAGSMIVFIMGLRTQFTGSADTYVYMGFFDTMKPVTDFQAYNEQRMGDMNFLLSESGFLYFLWLLSRIFSNSQILLVVTAIFITGSVCRFLRRNTTDVPTGLMAYVCLGLFTFNMNGMRQAMAMSVCLWAYEFVKERKLIPFVLTVLLAMQFHKTAICFFPVYLFPLMKNNFANIFVYLCGLIAFMLSMDWFIESFNTLSGKEYDVAAEAEGGGFTVLVIYAFVIFLSLLMNKKLTDKKILCEFMCVLLGFTCYIARYFSNQILERISYYFFYFTLLLIPDLFNLMDKKERQIVKVLFGFASMAILAYRVSVGSFSSFKLFFIR